MESTVQDVNEQTAKEVEVVLNKLSIVLEDLIKTNKVVPQEQDAELNKDLKKIVESFTKQLEQYLRGIIKSRPPKVIHADADIDPKDQDEFKCMNRSCGQTALYKDIKKKECRCPKCNQYMYNNADYEDKTSREQFRAAVRSAQEKKLSEEYETGGFDIMKKLVKKQRKHMDVKKVAAESGIIRGLNESEEEILKSTYEKLSEASEQVYVTLKKKGDMGGTFGNPDEVRQSLNTVEDSMKIIAPLHKKMKVEDL